MECRKKILPGVPRLRITRKSFLRLCLSGTALFMAEMLWGKKLPAFGAEVSRGRKKSGIRGDHDLVFAEGEDPYAATVRAVESLGGMEKFVRKNSTVVVKPNIAWDRPPELAANTNPQVVAALVDLCFKAGAKRVNVFDNSCNEARRCYASSGIEKTARARGANVFFAGDWNVLRASFAHESPMEGWPVFREALECDTFINVPILKHHGLTGLTLSMKNLMGVCSGRRGLIHTGIGRKLVDLTGFINPDLTVIDAYRILVRNGPVGGNPEDVELKKTIIAGTDPALTDTAACSLAGWDPLAVPYLAHARKINFGSFDLEAADILRVKT